jgi:hypothetical protein
MQNKWCVIGAVVGAVGFAGLTVWCFAAGNGWLTVLPGLLTLGIIRVAWWMAHSESFSPTTRKYAGDVGTNAAVAKWNVHREERAADAAAIAAGGPPKATLKG